MDSQAGRVVANEGYAVLEEGGCQRLDDVGRQRLRTLCQDFHKQCGKIAPDEEVRKLHARIQALEANHCYAAGEAGDQAQGAPADGAHLAAQLDGQQHDDTHDGATRNDEQRARRNQRDPN